MLKIAICDDEKVFRDNINKYVAAYLNEKEISYDGSSCCYDSSFNDSMLKPAS